MNPAQQIITDELAGLIMERIFKKIAPNLTEEDMEEIKRMDQNDEEGEKVRQFLTSKVPNFEQLLKDELELVKQELSPANT